jgi:hypothetical protein
MKKISTRHSMLFILAIFGLLVISNTAQAQYPYNDRYNDRYNDQNYGYNQQSTQVTINNGYQLGYGQGSNDRAYGRRFDVDNNKAYRDADSGYRNSGFRDKDQYKRLFRQGFEVGYRDGYSGARRRGYYSSGSTYSNPQYYPRDNRDYGDYRDYRNNPPRGRAYGHQRGRGNPHRYDDRYRY